MSSKFGTAAGFIACTLATCLCAGAVSLRTSPYASGTKRAFTVRDTHGASAHPAPGAYVAFSGGPSASGLRESRTRTGAPEKTSSGEMASSAFSGRPPYLPVVGPVPMRFDASGPLDRSQIIGLGRFVRIRAAALAAAEAEKRGNDPAGTRPVAAPAPVPETKTTADVEPESTAPATVATSGAKVTPSSGGTVSVSGKAAPEVAPEALMRYFAPRNDRNIPDAGMQFVLPYQHDQPLIMDSRAKYEQTGGGSGTAGNDSEQ